MSVGNKIPRAETAESIGLNSSVISKMTEEMAFSNIGIHSLMIIRNGKVGVESYSPPFTADSNHMVYSVSKSFLATAYGFALDEGKIKRTTRLVDIFPEAMPKKISKNLDKITIHHLLTMSAGKQTAIKSVKERDWLETFVTATEIFEPGEGFRYVSDNYYVAAMMLTKVLGQSITEYLTPRLYKPLGIDMPFWERSPDGVEAGGWGLMLKTEDIAKFIVCYLNDGVYNGKQVVPAWWVKEATSVLVDTSLVEKHSDSAAGYGCGFWNCKGMDNTFRAEGMFCQYAIAFKDYNAVLVMTADHSDLQETLDIIWEYMPSVFIEPCSSKRTTEIILPDKSAVITKPRQAIENRINGKTYKLKKLRFINFIGFPISVFPMPVVFFAAERGGNVQNLKFIFNETGLQFSWEEDGGFYNKIDVPMNGEAKINKVKIGELQLNVRSYAYWKNENSLVLHLRPLEAVAERIFEFQFKGNKIKMIPSAKPGTDDKAEKVGEKLKCILIGKFFYWWIDFLVPKVGRILNPIHYGKTDDSKGSLMHNA